MSCDHTYDLRDPGYYRLNPFLTGLVICVIVGAIALYLAGLPR